MKIFMFKSILALVIGVLITSDVMADFTVTGPTVVCPRGSYTYTASGASFLANQYKWYLSYDGTTIANSGSSSSTSFTINFDTANPGTAYIKVEANGNGVPGVFNPLNTYYFTVNMALPKPVTPNNGLILGCGANESITISSSPFIPYNYQDPSDVASCLFHCSYLWQSPAGWNFQFGSNSPSNSVEYSNDQNTIVTPSTVINGNNGFVTISAEFSQCAYNTNSSSSALLWIGTPAVSNGQVNGSAYAGGTLYVPSGYATLNVSITGGGSTNWYIANGSASINPSYNYCSVSWSGFVRVVVDASNRCGTGGSYTFYLSTQQGYYGYRVGPNPTKDRLSLLLDYKEMIGEAIQGVAIYDANNKLWYSANTDQLSKTININNSIDISTKEMPRGTYFLHVKMGDDVKKQQIILE